MEAITTLDLATACVRAEAIGSRRNISRGDKYLLSQLVNYVKEREPEIKMLIEPAYGESGN